MDVLNVLFSSQPTSHSLNVGDGRTPSPYQFVAWGGGHIPLSNPFVESEPFQSSSPSPPCVWGASMGRRYQSTSMSSTSALFTLYGGFKSNPFTASTMSVGVNPFPGQFFPWQGPFSSSGSSLGSTPLKFQWNPSQGMP
jgi:hypothetical protein